MLLIAITTQEVVKRESKVDGQTAYLRPKRDAAIHHDFLQLRLRQHIPSFG
jgi:hypothetical protein